MVVKFLELKIENFKSIENMSIVFKDKTVIRGANETGKSTIADSISWVLTGKNSLGDSTFNIVPIGTVGVSPSVELQISYNIIVDDKEYTRTPTLKRVLKAKIGRDKQFTGEYATECFVNGVKYTQCDFEKWIADNICDPEIFKLIHDVRYFTENISVNGKERPWEARRRLLTSICGVEHDNKLALLDERFKHIYERLPEFDDAAQLMSKLKADIAWAEKCLDGANYTIEQLDKMCFTNTPTGNKDELLQKKKQLEQQRDNLLKAYSDEVEQRNNRAYSLGQSVVQVGREVSEIYSKINNASIGIEGAAAEYEKHGISCPTCGRKFARGFSEKKMAEYEAHKAELEGCIEKLKLELDERKKVQEAVESEYKEILAKPQPKRPAEIDDIEKRIADLTAQIAVIEQSERQRAQFDEQKKRAIKERDELSEKLSHLQKDADLTKDFISYKAELVENKINELFDGVEIRMFHQNKNGEIRDCCEIFYHGTEYNSLSYSTRFVASIEIVMAFQHHTGITFPIVTDNSESIDLDADYSTQMIFLEKRDTPCPKCASIVGRRQADGLWHCSCGNIFVKPLTVECE